MIHQYKLNGYNIVLDVFSGSVHVTDDAAYEAIRLIDEGKDREEAKKALLHMFNKSNPLSFRSRMRMISLTT